LRILIVRTQTNHYNSIHQSHKKKANTIGINSKSIKIIKPKRILVYPKLHNGPISSYDFFLKIKQNFTFKIKDNKKKYRTHFDYFNFFDVESLLFNMFTLNDITCTLLHL